MSQKYAVLGHPVSHSRSPAIHGMFAEQEGADIEYRAIDVPPDDFREAWSDLVREGYSGCNFTVPFKERAMRLGGYSTRWVREAGAANTAKIDGPDGDGWIFDNTDGRGLLADLESAGPWTGDQKVLVVGAGGAARGIVPVLGTRGASITVANRTLGKLKSFRDEFGCRTLSYGDLAGEGFDVVINATSLSLTGEAPPLPDSVWAGCVLAYDLVYAKEDTAFMRMAKKGGVKMTMDGLGMLVRQAALSYRLWRGFEPEVEPVLRKLRLTL